MSEETFTYSCPNCKNIQTWRAESAGRPVTCACGTALQIPFCPGEAMRASSRVLASVDVEESDASDAIEPSRAARSDRSIKKQPADLRSVCPQCGHRLSPGWTQCPDCGYRRKPRILSHADDESRVIDHETPSSAVASPAASVTKPAYSVHTLDAAQEPDDSLHDTYVRVDPWHALLGALLVGVICAFVMAYFFCACLQWSNSAIASTAPLFALLSASTAGLAFWCCTWLGGGLYPFGPPNQTLYARLLLFSSLPLAASIAFANDNWAYAPIGFFASLLMLAVLLLTAQRLEWPARCLLGATVAISQFVILAALMFSLNRFAGLGDGNPNVFRYFELLAAQSALMAVALGITAAAMGGGLAQRDETV